mmetsp:Transcript_18343/g.35046  ORF Transcript_18343/g.35046 Transcript_18343/m.35046 type:complete len:103 (-) Transcript_18343:37-345(-)
MQPCQKVKNGSRKRNENSSSNVFEWKSDLDNIQARIEKLHLAGKCCNIFSRELHTHKGHQKVTAKHFLTLKPPTPKAQMFVPTGNRKARMPACLTDSLPAFD